MNRPTSLLRALAASAAMAAAVALGGCQTDGVLPARAMQPLSAQMLAQIEQMNMDKESPIIVRIFKEEAELEVWKQDRTGRFALLKTYPICRWSGELGPKIKEGDRQAPEGFYTITPGMMNPNSQYYLSFNTGFPNPYDKAMGRTGAALMVHGDCSSRGCYAMTDDQIGEIYALGREAFFGGQRAFQLQAYPFRMTALNMARHRNNPNMAFWRMLKVGYDHFEVSRLQPKVDFCERRYVFDAEAPPNATTQPVFDASKRCPAYVIPQELAAAVADKQRTDNVQTADLIRRGTAAAPIRTGRDGGMHPTFLARLRAKEIRGPNGEVRMVVDPDSTRPLGTYVNPPHDPDQPPAAGPESNPVVTADVPMPRPAPQPKQGVAPDARLAAAPPPPPQNGNLFTGLFSNSDRPRSDTPSEGPLSRVGRWMGITADDPKTPPARKTPPAPRAAPAPQLPPPAAVAARPPQQPRPAPQPDPAPPTQTASAPPAPAVLPGAQPVVQADSFDSRFGGTR